jgi:hypothetical protein
VTFDKENPATEVLAGGGLNQPFRGKATVNATFKEAGDYVLHVTANDYSGEGGSGECVAGRPHSSRLLSHPDPSQASDIKVNVVANWLEELKRLGPTH